MTSVLAVAQLLGMKPHAVRRAVAAMKNDGSMDPAMLVPPPAPPRDPRIPPA